MKAPRGIRNNNPGNLRLPASSTRPGDEGHDKDGFSKFSTPQHGLDSLARLLVNYGKAGVNTIAGIITKYAPPSENDTDAYTLFVANKAKLDPLEPLDMKSSEIISALMTAIIAFENGRQPYTRTMIYNAVQKAVGGPAGFGLAPMSKWSRPWTIKEDWFQKGTKT